MARRKLLKSSARVRHLLVTAGALAGGDSFDDVLEDYPNITREDIVAALQFASELSDFQEGEYDASPIDCPALI